MPPCRQLQALPIREKNDPDFTLASKIILSQSEPRRWQMSRGTAYLLIPWPKREESPQSRRPNALGCNPFYQARNDGKEGQNKQSGWPPSTPLSGRGLPSLSFWKGLAGLCSPPQQTICPPLSAQGQQPCTLFTSHQPAQWPGQRKDPVNTE